MSKKAKKWAIATLIRTARTMAQAFLGYVGGATLISEVDWAVCASTVLLSGIVCIAMSITGLPEVKGE